MTLRKARQRSRLSKCGDRRRRHHLKKGSDAGSELCVLGSGEISCWGQRYGREPNYSQTVDAPEYSWEIIMRIALMAVAVTVICFGSSASAQQAVRPQWNYQGSAVCPDGFDYAGGLCRARGYGSRAEYRGGPGYGGAGYGGGGVEPRWNRSGSAVCPEGYDFHARSGACRPQRY